MNIHIFNYVARLNGHSISDKELHDEMLIVNEALKDIMPPDFKLVDQGCSSRPFLEGARYNGDKLYSILSRFSPPPHVSNCCKCRLAVSISFSSIQSYEWAVSVKVVDTLGRTIPKTSETRITPSIKNIAHYGENFFNAVNEVMGQIVEQYSDESPLDVTGPVYMDRAKYAAKNLVNALAICKSAGISPYVDTDGYCASLVWLMPKNAIVTEKNEHDGLLDINQDNIIKIDSPIFLFNSKRQKFSVS